MLLGSLLPVPHSRASDAASGPTSASRRLRVQPQVSPGSGNVLGVPVTGMDMFVGAAPRSVKAEGKEQLQ